MLRRILLVVAPVVLAVLMSGCADPPRGTESTPAFRDDPDALRKFVDAWKGGSAEARSDLAKQASEGGAFVGMTADAVVQSMGEPALEDYFYEGHLAYMIGPAIPPDDLWLMLDLDGDRLVTRTYVASD